MIDYLDQFGAAHQRRSRLRGLLHPRTGQTFERSVGGMPLVRCNAYKFVPQKINLHVRGSEFDPKANLPVPSVLHHCFIASNPLTLVVQQLQYKDWSGRHHASHKKRNINLF